MRRLVLSFMIVLAAGCSRPLPWDRPEPPRPLAPPGLPEADRGAEAAADWAVGLSDDVRQAMEDLQGTWIVTRARRSQAVDPALANATVTLTGKHFTTRGGRVITKGTWTVDPSRDPKTLELVYSEGPEAGQKVEGIYSRYGNVWIVIYSAPGQPPPMSFKQATDPGWILLTLRRAD